jgi:hypothetical protein
MLSPPLPPEGAGFEIVLILRFWLRQIQIRSIIQSAHLSPSFRQQYQQLKLPAYKART